MRHPQLDGQVISGETSWNKPPRLTQHSVCFGPEHLLFIRLLRTVCFFGILSHPAWNQHVETRQSWTFRSNIFHDPPVIVSSYHSALISTAAAGKDGDADVLRGTQVKSIFVLPGLDISNGLGNMKSRTPLSDYNSDLTATLSGTTILCDDSRDRSIMSDSVVFKSKPSLGFSES